MSANKPPWTRAEPQRCEANWSLQCTGYCVCASNGGAICESCLLAARVALRYLSERLIKVKCNACGVIRPAFGGSPIGPFCEPCIDAALLAAAALRVSES